MTELTATIQYLKIDDVKQAILNWQNAVGCELNGQLETFLGITLGHINEQPNGLIIQMYGATKVMERTKILLKDNHHALIKAWLARNE